MLSNSCRYGIRAVIYLASHYPLKTNIGIKQISNDLDLPAPFLAKILQQLAKSGLISSTKGPNGGFLWNKKPESITMFDIIKTIDGEGIFKNCIIRDGYCSEVRKSKKSCPVHDGYSRIRAELVKLYKSKTVAKLVKTAGDTGKVFI